MRDTSHPARGHRMKTYEAGKDTTDSPVADGRDWVFTLLENPRYRERLAVLAGLDLRRRAGCEECLRSLVVDEWTPETLHHVGWCDSCRKASIALGKIDAAAAAGTRRRRRALVV